jgi:hypothetical protein
MRLLVRYILLAALVSDCRSQDAAFSSDVKVVSLLATVRDHSGTIVGNLTKDDFQLEEDGRPQTIRYFSRESDPFDSTRRAEDPFPHRYALVRRDQAVVGEPHPKTHRTKSVHPAFGRHGLPQPDFNRDRD